MSNYFRKFLSFILLFVFFVFTLNSCVFADDLSEDDNLTNEKEIIYECLSTDLLVSAKDTVPTINSRSAVVIDRNSQSILYGKNEFNKVKMASTTKIMTATIVIENANLKDVVTVSKKAASTRRFKTWIKNWR